MTLRRSTSVAAGNALRAARRRAGLPLAAVLLAAFVPALSASAQSQTTSQSSSAQSSQAAQTAPSAATMQVAAGAKQESLADAARANAEKPKPKPKHVYTDDDLANMGGNISVVGDSSSGRANSENSASNAQNANGGSSESKDEAYWRGQAQQIKDQIADVDRQIEDKKAEIAKAGPASFDPSTGLSQGVIIVHDRNAELKDLEDHKQSLENQLDQLADQGRAAGADPGWFR